MRALLPLLLLAACASAPEPQASTGPVRPYEDGRPARSATASLWNQDPQSLFGNRRARGVGDIVTVLVAVDDEAEMRNSLDASRDYQDTLSINALGGVPSLASGVLPGGATLAPAIDIERARAAAGTGRIARRETVTLELAAMVVAELPSGLFEIEGTQRIRVNAETRDLKVHGYVRPEDITRDNTISHRHIASADIVYEGAGQVARTTRPRWGGRLLDILVPF